MENIYPFPFGKVYCYFLIFLHGASTIKDFRMTKGEKYEGYLVGISMKNKPNAKITCIFLIF